MIQNRLKSKVAWLAVVSLIGFILGNFGLYDYIGLTSDTYKTFVDLLFGALTAFGIFNDPTSSDSF